MSRQSYLSSLLPPLLWLILILFSLPAGAATYTVTNLNDSGPGSLRQAILDAAGDDTIVFQSGLSGTITLTSGPLTISNNLTINGPGANVLAVSGNNVSPVFVIRCGGPTVFIDRLAIKDGNSTYSGGGITNGGGTLTVSNSIVSGNLARDGGGISSHTVMCELGRFNGKLTVINSTVSGNSAVTPPPFTGNGVGGGISIGPETMATIINSTLSDNSASSAGGGINSWGTLTISNSTISGNSSLYGGGGIFNLHGGTLTLGNSIVAGNTAPTGKEVVNITSPGPGISAGIFISQGHNLFGENGASGVEGVEEGTLAASDIVPTIGISAILAPLGDYGGPTQTHALQPNSVAINAIPVKPVDYCTLVTGEPLTTDQRGVKRPQGSACDIGAFEYDSQFSAFNVALLIIDQNRAAVFLWSKFTLGKGKSIDPVKEDVTLKIADFTMTIPAGSFQKNGYWPLFASFAGQIDNVWIEAFITPLGRNCFKFQALAYGAQLGDTKNPVTVELTIGDDGGTTTANASTY